MMCDVKLSKREIELVLVALDKVEYSEVVRSIRCTLERALLME